MERPEKRFFEFDSFRVDTGERVLLRDGQPIVLTPKVFDLLLLLVENNRHTLSKDELMDRLWSESVVEENSLSRNISLLRKALGNGSDDIGGYIKTVPKRGYRFESDLHVVLEDEEELIVEKRTNYSVTLSQNRATASRTWATRVVAISAAAVGVVVLIAWAATRSEGEASGLTVRNTEAQLEASELYRRGRELWQNRSASGLHEATLLLEQAVERDPENALARSALADAYAFDARNWRKVEQVATDASRLDPTLGHPYASLGFVRLFWQWNPADAEANFKRAISLSPAYATAHQWYGLLLASVGHLNEGLAEMQRALELEPNSAAINADLCQMLYFVGRNHEAEAQCKRTLEIDPNFFSAYSHLYAIYSMQGKEREAFESFLTQERISVNSASLPADFEQYRTAFDRGGIVEFWREHIRLRRRFGTECGVGLAWVHAYLGEKNDAIVCLQRAVERRELDLVYIYADPVLRRLGDHAEYDDIANRMMNSQLSRSDESQ